MGYPRRQFFVGCLSTVLLLAGGAAQSASTEPRRVVVRAGHLLDVKTGSTLSGQAIVIEGDKIVSVGPAAEVKVAPDVDRLNCPTRPCCLA